MSFIHSEQVTWYPKFGCALLAVGSDGNGGRGSCTEVNEFTLYMVSLDAWSHRLHSSPSDIQPTAVCKAHTLEGCGDVVISEYPQLLSMVETLQAQSQQDRSEGKKGLQHTPAFMLAVVKDALSVLALQRSSGISTKTSGPNRDPLTRTFAQGGYTDVGQHTGSFPRDTSWPLVRETFKAVLAKFSAGDSDAPVQFRCLFDTMMARFELWLLRRQVDIVTPSAASATMLNSCMTMLASACLKGGQLAARGYSITGFEAACLEVRARLAAAASVRAVAVAKEFELPRTSTIAYKQMTGVIPEAELPVAVGGGLAAARLRSAANLGSLPVLPAGSSFTTLLAFLADETLWLPTATSKDVLQQLALCCVEQELFGKAASGFNNVSLSCSEVDALVEVVDRDRAQLHAFHESAASQAVMQAGLRSRELLVVWVAYCFTHAATCTEHPVLLKYGAALRYVDLRHLVLSDKAAVDAALSVGAYLPQHTAVVAGTAVAGNAVFSLRDGSEATLCMALEYAEGDPAMGKGTATPLGDPIELEGLNQAFRRSTDERAFCALGSVKSNIGHTVMAAGAAGVIKTALALFERRLPPTLHFTATNPKMDFAGSPFVVNDQLRPWPAQEGPRRAGVSSFGVGGTNAHVILEEAPARAPSDPSVGAQLLLLCARTPSALGTVLVQLGAHLERAPEANLADIAWTLAHGRKPFARRAHVVADTVEEAAAKGQVLTKLEDPQFIHAYTQSAATDPSHGMRFELPRFNLGFELRQRQLVSLEYSGYKLSKRQQLVTRVVDQLCSTDGNVRSALYTLPDFHQYLLLQRIPCKDVLVGDRRADSIALVLVGRVVSAKGSLQHAESSVRISRDSSSSAKLQSPIIGVGISEGKVSQSSSSGGGGGGLVMSLEEEMHLELKDSWHAFHSSPTARHVVKGTEEVILDKQSQVKEARSRMQAQLLQAVAQIPRSVGRCGASFRMMQASATAPIPGLLDLTRVAWKPQLLKDFNPFLSDASCKNIHQGVLVWLQLCVLEDRLSRLHMIAAGGDDLLPMLIQELLVHRTWDVAQHPQWLVFEAEGQLQIRPAQHWIANHLIENPGAITQLNMGEGKTRVILPMLVLHWADGSKVGWRSLVD
ncbi:MAG: hypothetical protein WDW38_010396 [Sanguina aurantia]